MAINTVNEKLALISLLQPWNVPIPISADGIDQADQQQLLWGYPGLLWDIIAGSYELVEVFGELTELVEVVGELLED